MTCAVLILVFLILGAVGYRIMDRLDRFLKKHVICEADTDETDGGNEG